MEVSAPFPIASPGSLMDPELFLRRVDWALLSIEPVVWPKVVDEEQAPGRLPYLHLELAARSCPSYAPKNVSGGSQKGRRSYKIQPQKADFLIFLAMFIDFRSFEASLSRLSVCALAGDLRGALKEALGEQLSRQKAGNYSSNLVVRWIISPTL